MQAVQFSVGQIKKLEPLAAKNLTRLGDADVVRRLGKSLGSATVGRFSDGEVNVELLENVRGKDVFVLQPTCVPTNDNIMELLIMVDALKRASAGRITAAIPYFGYARQDRRPRSARVPITAKLVANMLQAAGVQRVLTVDLHADQIQGFFDIPVDNIYATPILLGDVWKQVKQDGLKATWQDRSMWNQMRMLKTDLSDVTGYTFLVNGQTPQQNWTGAFKTGEKVRLRFINASAMSFFDVRIPGLKMTVVAADGLPVRPVTVDEFRIAVAETFDVIVEPSGQDAFTIFAQAMDRTGFAAGTLAVRAGLSAGVPDLDPRPVLTMADMGHGGMDHDMGAIGTTQASTPTPAASDPHAGHMMPPSAPAPTAPAAADPHAGHVMPEAPAAAAPDPHAGHTMPPTQTPAPVTPDPHAGHDMSAMSGGMQTHPASEQGNPLVDMQTMAPSAKLDDPGIGLRGNGRRVLTYADLTSVFDNPDGREPTRTIELHLTGHMERFAWSFDGIKFSGADPIRLTYGERVRIVLVNDTMMTHPIHLHGMWSDLEDADGKFKVRKHTIDMPPGARRSYRVTADALGRWAYHCHLLFHMEAGMMREVRVEEGRQS